MTIVESFMVVTQSKKVKPMVQKQKVIETKSCAIILLVHLSQKMSL